MKIVSLTELELEELIERVSIRSIDYFLKKQKSSQPEKLITLNQLAKKLGISYNKLRADAEKGKIKLQAGNRVTQSEVNKYLANEN